MTSYSLANHLLRALLIWALVFAVIYSKQLKLSKKLIIATLVTVFYLVTEYLLMPLYVPDFCNMACPPPMNTDNSIEEAVAKLKLQEQAGPAVTPPAELITAPVQAVQAPQVSPVPVQAQVSPVPVQAPQPQVPVQVPQPTPTTPPSTVPQLPPPVSTSVRV